MGLSHVTYGSGDSPPASSMKGDSVDLHSNFDFESGKIVGSTLACCLSTSDVHAKRASF